MPSSDRSLTLLVPGLLQEAAPGARIEALERLLARADAESFVEGCPERQVFALFGIGPPAGQDLPVAAVTYALDEGTPDPSGWWLRADPCHCVPDRDRVVLLACQDLGITSEEAAALIVGLNRQFESDGLHFMAPTPRRWYLRLAEAPALRTVEASRVLGQDIHPFLPGGADGRRWHTLLNEMQMLLHAHPVNVAREARGEPTINSVWLWGGGSLPTVPRGTWAQVWSDDALTLGLAKQAGTPRCGTPASGTDWLRQAVTPGQHLVVLDPGRYAAAEIDALWIAPLLDALRSGQIQALILYPGTAARYRLTRGLLRRWWRRRRSLESYR